MSKEVMIKKENLRDSARGILDVLTRIEGNMNLLGGELPSEVRDDVEANGAVDELFVLLNDIRYLANRIEITSDAITGKI